MLCLIEFSENLIPHEVLAPFARLLWLLCKSRRAFGRLRPKRGGDAAQNTSPSVCANGSCTCLFMFHFLVRRGEES